MHFSRNRRRLLALSPGVLAACSATPDPAALALVNAPDTWHDLPIPGKTRSRYRAVTKEGRQAYEALADRSASMWRRHVQRPAAELGRVGFSWWVSGLLPEASVAQADREDAVARVIFGFDGDASRLSARTRALYELAQLLTGEAPPYATLMYVWESQAMPLETVIHNPRSDRIRKIVLDSGPAFLNQWRDHERDLRTDFERVFGEPPGDLRSVAFMTDADNTEGQARTWYGPVRWG
jgi:Protein of unknown function (DUF3047)